jgi:hypothetical protein
LLLLVFNGEELPLDRNLQVFNCLFNGILFLLLTESQHGSDGENNITLLFSLLDQLHQLLTVSVGNIEVILFEILLSLLGQTLDVFSSDLAFMLVVIVFINEGSDFVTGIFPLSVDQGQSYCDHYLFIGSIEKNNILGDFNDSLHFSFWVLSFFFLNL